MVCGIGVRLVFHTYVAEEQKSAEVVEIVLCPLLLTHIDELHRISCLGNDESDRTRNQPEVLIRSDWGRVLQSNIPGWTYATLAYARYLYSGLSDFPRDSSTG